MTNEKIIALANKLYELTQRGVGGEKENAVTQLNKLMEKYNITLNDLNEETTNFFTFKWDWSLYISKKLLCQIIFMVVPEEHKYKTDKKYTVGVYCTHEQRLEIIALYNFYLDAFKNDLKIFYRAFLNQNDLYPADEKYCNENPTEEELKLYKSAILMAQGLNKHQYLKQLETSKETLANDR